MGRVEAQSSGVEAAEVEAAEAQAAEVHAVLSTGPDADLRPPRVVPDRTTADPSTASAASWHDLPDVEEEPRMAQDVNPPSRPDRRATEQLPPVPYAHAAPPVPARPPVPQAAPAPAPGLRPGLPPAPPPGTVDPWWTRPAPVVDRPPAAWAGRRSTRQSVNARGRRRALTVLGVVGALPLLAALAVVLLLPDPPSPPQAAAVPERPAQTAASRGNRETTTAAPSTEPTRPPGQPADLAQVGADAATADLNRAGISDQGEISTAWEWSDQRGRSLVAAVREVTDRAGDGSPRKVSLRVYYVTALDGSPQVLRRLRDPSLTCSDGGTMDAGFTAAAFGVHDLDGDGAPEVIVGWTGHCGDPSAASRIRLAVMSGPKLYVLRGSGVPAAPTTAPGTATAPGPGTATGDAPTPVPAASQWPSGLLDATMALFHSVYY
jgi:hypothetical protein